MTSTAVEKPLTFAVTERGRTLRHTEDEVELALRLLILNGGQYKPTVEQLLAENLYITREQLKAWRDNSFPRFYMRLRQELGGDVGEEVAGRAMERALQADEAEAVYIEAAMEKVDEVPAEHLAKGALALAQAKSQNIEKSELLRGRPTERKQIDLGEAVSVLERLGVLEKAEVVEAEVVGEETL